MRVAAHQPSTSARGAVWAATGPRLPAFAQRGPPLSSRRSHQQLAHGGLVSVQRHHHHHHHHQRAAAQSGLDRPLEQLEEPAAVASTSSGAHGGNGVAAAAAAVTSAEAAAAAASPSSSVDAAAVAVAAAAAAHGAGTSSSGSSTAFGSSDSDGESPVPEAPSPTPAAKPGGASNFIKRVIFGLILGLGGAAVVAVGSVPYLLAALFVSYGATQEYYGFLTSKGIRQGRSPPPAFMTATTTALCLSISLATFANIGRSGTVLSVAAFLLLVLNVVALRKPKFAQLTSSVFGLFYCGYLPSFWLKLRNISVPGPELAWPALGALLPQLTVGLAATLTAVACIIAADTGAYFVGKNLGRTKLTDISPKKTVEGAAGGLASAVAASLLLWGLLGWPSSAAAAAGYGVVAFFSSLFGDLIESIMKRDAGLKDSGDLIPGHGGLLDRFDSYMFTGATSYFYITFLLPKLGLL